MSGMSVLLLLLIILAIIFNSYQILRVFFKKSLNKVSNIKDIIVS